MATRATVTINHSIHLYHHYDGYLAGVGREIARLIKLGKHQPMTKVSATEWLINQRGYEVTTAAYNHIDRQYHYDVQVLPSGEVLAQATLIDNRKKGRRVEYAYFRSAVAASLLAMRENKRKTALELLTNATHAYN